MTSVSCNRHGGENVIPPCNLESYDSQLLFAGDWLHLTSIINLCDLRSTPDHQLGSRPISVFTVMTFPADDYHEENTQVQYFFKFVELRSC